MKRTLSLLLALVMILGSFPAVFAASESVEEKAGALLFGLDVLRGVNDAGDLELDASLTRQDALVMLSRLIEGVDDKVFNSYEVKEDYPFTDVPAGGYQAVTQWAYDNEITLGKGDGEFGFGDVVTAQQYVTFLMRALGYEVEAGEAYDKVLETAGDKGLLELVDVKNETELTRGVMAVLTYNALNAELADGSKTLAEKLELDVPVLVEGPEFEIEEVKATKVNELTVTFAGAVDKDEVEFKVVRGTTNVAIEKVVWNSDNTVAKLETTAKMSNGTYTVEATLEELTATGSTEVVSQFVNQIVILNDVALTGSVEVTDEEGNKVKKESMEAYAYYDVLDQYGESIRNTTNITWSGSVDRKADRTTGRITLTRSDGRAFTYGEQIFLSGVDTKTGVNVTKTLTVGQAQALDTIEVKGFVKKGTTEILKVLPAGFKADTYEIVFAVKDQNGNSFKADNEALKDQIAFVSDNPLVISEIVIEETEKSIVIDGEEYYKALVKPGINVDRGGEVNILVIATRTGNKDTINTVVGENQVLTTFELVGPKDMVADNEEVEIEFNAYDQHGERIQNFTTLARHESFNALSFTSSDNTKVKLKENNDGTASLIFIDDEIGWDDSRTTDDLDRKVSITSIVVGGNSDNLMIDVQDKARPEAIKSVDIDNVLVYLGQTSVELAVGGDFEFLDQYGRDMTRNAALEFFKASLDGDLSDHSNRDFKDYKFGVRATYKGQGEFNYTHGSDSGKFGNDQSVVLISTDTDNKLTLKADGLTEAPTAAKTGMSVRFDIVKYKSNPAEAESVSTVKTEPLTIVNIKQVKSIEIEEVGKVYIQTTYSTSPVYGGEEEDINENATGTIPSTHERKLSLVGKYNGVEVEIPSVYVAKSAPTTGTALKLDLVERNDDGKDVIAVTVGSGLKWSDLYDVTTARFVRKASAQDVLTVDVFDRENDDSEKERYTTATTVVSFSDAEPVLTEITGADEWTATPDTTVIDTINGRFKVGGTGKYKYLDQYGVSVDSVYIRYRVSKVEENPDGYVLNNFRYEGNDSPNLKIYGAERGDKFVITIVASDGKATVTKEVKVTVGADKQANITNNDNNYLEKLIGDTVNGLEEQRKASLK